MSERFDVPQGSELRFETERDMMKATLLEGAAECFGTPMEVGREYQYPAGAKSAIQATTDAKVVLTNHTSSVVEPHSLGMYNDLKALLAARRQQAQIQNTRGPRVLVAGKTDSGKSTLCKILINDATRSGHAVTYIDTDLGQNGITVPGSVAAVYMDRGQTVDIEEGFSLLQPLVFCFGTNTVSKERMGYFHHICRQLEACIEANEKGRNQFQAGGVIINTMGWVTGIGLDLLKLVITSLNVDVVVTLNDGDRSLGDAISKDFGGRVTLHELNRPQGVAVRKSEYRQMQRGKTIEYYFGGVKTLLKSERTVVPFSELEVYKIGSDGPPANPRIPNFLATSKVDPSPERMACRLGAVSYASNPDEIIHANIAGFVLFERVDIENQEYTLQTPASDALPSRYIILTDIRPMFK